MSRERRRWVAAAEVDTSLTYPLVPPLTTAVVFGYGRIGCGLLDPNAAERAVPVRRADISRKWR